jgi:CRP/FNR family transcriptional regulator, cyclic AMP receptor protein
MAKSLQVLDRTDLFGSLPPDLLAELAGQTELRKYERGEHICRQGEVARELWIVFSGRIAISARATDGREAVMAVLGPGALFGEMPLFDGEVRSADARALTPAHLIAVGYDDVRAVLQTRPEVLWPVTKIMARRLRSTNGALADAMFLDVTGRTAKRLLEIAADDDEFRMPLTQEELAGMVGASRERVNKAIATFVKLGWLEVQGRTLYRILDRSEMELRSHI